MKSFYSQQELDSIASAVLPRSGWDFSRMVDWRAPVSWDYSEVVAAQVDDQSDVLDIGTGGGERLLSFAPIIGSGLGIDLDPELVAVAARNGRDEPKVSFRLSSHELENVSETFDVALNRHAPFSLQVLPSRLNTDGVFITQQVGERNMGNIKEALGQDFPSAPISRDVFDGSGLTLVEFREYDVEYVVRDVESLVFWLSALDFLHADINGSDATTDADVLNRILDGNVTADGFVTNEHRYLAIARP
jgi:SAM-dependent methyltransferase